MTCLLRFQRDNAFLCRPDLPLARFHLLQPRPGNVCREQRQVSGQEDQISTSYPFLSKFEIREAEKEIGNF